MISLGGYLQIKFASLNVKALSQKEIEIFDLCEHSLPEIFKNHLSHEITEKQLLEVLDYFDFKKKRAYSRRIRAFLTKNGVELNKVHDDKYIYLIGNQDGLVKIGRSKDPIKRVRELSTGSGVELLCVAYWKVDADSLSIEKEMHEYFSEYRVKGEWFSFKDKTIEDIEVSISCKFERVYYNKFIQNLTEKSKYSNSFITIENETQKAYLFRNQKGLWWCPKVAVKSISYERGVVFFKYDFKPHYNGKKKFWRE